MKEIFISSSAKEPIYEQIAVQIKRQIEKKHILPNDAIPSIRALAKTLRVSIITTKRAYEDLERDKYIYTVAGKGCFVCEVEESDILAEGKKQMYVLVKNACALAKHYGITKKEIVNLIEEEL